jgi:hypothetical protein
MLYKAWVIIFEYDPSTVLTSLPMSLRAAIDLDRSFGRFGRGAAAASRWVTIFASLRKASIQWQTQHCTLSLFVQPHLANRKTTAW